MLLVMCNRLEQDSLISECTSKIMETTEKIELEKRRSCDMDSELQRQEQMESDLLCRLKEIRASNSSMEQEVHASDNTGLQAALVVIFKCYRRPHF
jgi:hypothetical protein